MVPNFKLYFLIIYLFPLFLAAQTGETRASIFETAHYVTNDKSAVQMVRFDAIYFESDSISVQQKYWSSLDYLIHWLKSNSDTQIELHGHTNGIPSYNYCKNLGKKKHFTYRNVFKSLCILENSLFLILYFSTFP